MALRDVSSSVRAAAAANPSLPSDALAELARDRVPLVRAAAYTALATRGETEVLSIALTLETRPELLVAVLYGAGRVAAAEALLEHDAPAVRAAAVRNAPPECVLELLADPSPDVRAAARDAVVASGTKLAERDVAAAAQSGSFVDIMQRAKIDSLPAFARAVVCLERIAAGVSDSMNDGEAARAENSATADAAGVALREVVRRHPRFARAFDLAREPDNRLVPVFL